MTSARPRPRGFTLIEMMVTVAIMGILASIVVPLAQMSVQRSREQELRLALREIRTAIDAYKAAGDEGRIARSATSTGYPRSLSDLVEGVPDLRHPRHPKIYFLRRLPTDPMMPPDAVRPWGLRAYASSAEAPRPGDDVYDVYSQSAETGLNGKAYREW